MSPALIAAFAGTTGFIGLVAVLAFLYVNHKVSVLEKTKLRSVREIVEGEGIFNADQVIDILKTFKSDSDRLIALQTLAEAQNKSQTSATRVYRDISAVTKSIDYKEQQILSIRARYKSIAPVFIVFSIISFSYGIFTNKNFINLIVKAISSIFHNEPAEQVYKLCSNPTFGIAEWSNKETFEGRSGWRGGGYSQPAFCTEYSTSVIQNRGLSQSPYNIRTVSSDESRRKDFLGKAEYNYTCTVEILWGPLYNQRRDPICGIE